VTLVSPITVGTGSNLAFSNPNSPVYTDLVINLDLTGAPEKIPLSDIVKMESSCPDCLIYRYELKDASEFVTIESGCTFEEVNLSTLDLPMCI
jgi:hypothetical protein